jgi:hypothetical protein
MPGNLHRYPAKLVALAAEHVSEFRAPVVQNEMACGGALRGFFTGMNAAVIACALHQQYTFLAILGSTNLSTNATSSTLVLEARQSRSGQ